MGLFISKILGLIVRVCVIYKCCCCLLDIFRVDLWRWFLILFYRVVCLRECLMILFNFVLEWILCVFGLKVILL